jgi:superfamily II DNA or RNA helicase
MANKKDLPLFDHQKWTKELLKKSERVLDASDPGTGKTRAALEAFSERRKKGGGKALIIAPKSLLQSSWGDDIDDFGIPITYICAYANNRAEAFAIDADTYITNTDAVKWLAKQPAQFFKDFDTLIIDEIHYFKHRTSQRSKSINKIKKYFKYREGMTGTPNSNTIP